MPSLVSSQSSPNLYRYVATQIAAGKAYHVVVTVGTDVMRMYVNGEVMDVSAGVLHETRRQSAYLQLASLELLASGGSSRCSTRARGGTTTT